MASSTSSARQRQEGVAFPAWRQISRRRSSNKLLLYERWRSRQSINDADSGRPLVQDSAPASDEVDRLPRNLRVHFYSVIFAVLSGLSYLFDFGTDILVGFSQFAKCRYVEGVLILTFAYAPSIFVNTLGYLWAMDDLNRRPTNYATNRFKKPVWRVGVLTQTVPALYSFEAAYYLRTFRRLLAANNGVVDARILELYYWILESDRDSTLLRVFLAFLESAPQLFIQTYVLFKNVFSEEQVASPNSFYAWVHYVSMAFSLFGLSWSMMSQHRCLRYVRQDKENLGVLQCVLILVWRTLTLVGRMTALLLFALNFGYWLIALLAAHYLLILALLFGCEKPKLADSITEQRLLLFGVAWVHLFCPWNVDEGRTRYRYLWRYGLELSEFVVIVVCLIFARLGIATVSDEYFYIIAAACCYVVGLIFMGIYYGCCHPNLLSGRRRYPPLVVVYAPSEKASAATVPAALPAASPAPAPVPVPVPAPVPAPVPVVPVLAPVPVPVPVVHVPVAVVHVPPSPVDDSMAPVVSDMITPGTDGTECCDKDDCCVGCCGGTEGNTNGRRRFRAGHGNRYDSSIRSGGGGSFIGDVGGGGGGGGSIRSVGGGGGGSIRSCGAGGGYDGGGFECGGGYDGGGGGYDGGGTCDTGGGGGDCGGGGGDGGGGDTGGGGGE